MKHPAVPTSMDYSDKCNGCGLCCIIPGYGDCPNLMRLGNGLTKCKIYGKHIGTKLPLGYVCSSIMELKHGFEDCPYNEDKKQPLEILTKEDIMKLHEIQKLKISESQND